MDAPFGRCLFSPLFTFQVGPDKKEVTVHSSALAELSPSLNTLINGKMIEARTRRVDWSDVDLDTFTRLCEFAYLRDYTSPLPRLISGYAPTMNRSPTPEELTSRKRKRRTIPRLPASASEPEPEIVVLEYPLCPEEAAVLPHKRRTFRTCNLKSAFTESLVNSAQKSKNSNYDFAPPKNTGPWEDFTPVLIDQVRMYVLADKWGIEHLCHIVLSKLHETLKSFELYGTGVAGVIEFVRFVYSNTPPKYGNNVDAMRNLAARYVVSVLGQIGEHEALKELLEEGGAFVKDFWNIIWSEKGATRPL